MNSKPNFGTKSNLSGVKVETSPFGSSKIGAKKESSTTGMSSGIGGTSMKPNFKSNSRSTANKYW